MGSARGVQGTLVVSLAVLLVSCTRQPPDRTNLVQLPLFFLMLVAPVVSFPLKRCDSGMEVISLIVQVAAYVFYETGVSADKDNRADLVLLFPAIALNAWIVFGSIGSPKPASEADDVLPGVSLPLVRNRCDVCGMTYPAEEPLRADRSGRHVCSNCAKSAISDN